MIPGEVFAAQGDIEINVGRELKTLTVSNTGDRPIQVENRQLQRAGTGRAGARLRGAAAARRGRGGLCQAAFPAAGAASCRNTYCKIPPCR